MKRLSRILGKLERALDAVAAYYEQRRAIESGNPGHYFAEDTLKVEIQEVDLPGFNAALQGFTRVDEY